MTCLRFVSNELDTSADVNPLGIRHAESYSGYLARVAASLAPQEVAYHKDLTARLEKYLDAICPLQGDGRKSPRSGDTKNRTRNFAPVSVPLERRLQTVVAVVYNFFRAQVKGRCTRRPSPDNTSWGPAEGVTVGYLRNSPRQRFTQRAPVPLACCRSRFCMSPASPTYHSSKKSEYKT